MGDDLRDLPGGRRLARVGLTTALAVAALVVAQADLLARVLAPLATTPAAVASWGPPAAGLLGVLALRAGLGWYRRAAIETAAAATTRALRHRLISAVGRLGPARLQRERAGELSTLVGTGLDGLHTHLTLDRPQRSLAVVVPLAVLARLAVADPLSAAVVAATLPLIPVFGALVGTHTRASEAGQWRALARLGAHFLDVLRGLPTLHAFGRAAHQVTVVAAVAQEYRRASMTTLRTAFLSGLALDSVASVSVALVAVPVGLRLLDGGLRLGTGLLVLLLAPEATRPLRELGAAFHAAAAGRAAADRARALVEQAPRPVVARPPARALRRAGAVVELAGVSTRYPGASDPALRDVHLRLGAGERVALTGPSGAGKSTVLALLLGFLPAVGDGHVGGVGIGALATDPSSLARWRAQVTWLPQRPHLFAGTVADNIALGAPEADPREIRAAAEAAEAAGFIEDLPDGYATVLGERGGGLSAGQRRRVALARAFLRDTPLLLLDEPTAGLDPVTEAGLRRSLAALTTGRTVLVATHRPALLGGVDRVLTVDGGRLTDPAALRQVRA